MPVNAARKYKKEKRARMTMETILLEVLRMLRERGYQITDTQEIPSALAHALSGHPIASTVPALEPDLVIDSPEDDLLSDLNGLEVGDVPGRLIEEKIPEDYLEQWKAAQNRLVERVATEGIHYANQSGPAEGKRLAPHPSIPAAKPTSTTTAPDPAGWVPDKDGGGTDDSERVNPRTGLTLNQARELIARATGRRPEPPSGGMPNRLRK
jgi:hypothetical protein